MGVDARRSQGPSDDSELCEGGAEHLRSIGTKLTLLVPTDASLKCITRRTNEHDNNAKLLKGKALTEGGMQLAEREGFGLAA